ncbi:MAG: hypothetical protein KKC71_08565 [Chloroflexi bacterium]|nr:hypothetical protein [Chloroflexota bacterium]
MKTRYIVISLGLIALLGLGGWWLRTRNVSASSSQALEATLGIFLKGVGLDILWQQVLALTLYGLVFLILSTFRFRKSLA